MFPLIKYHSHITRYTDNLLSKWNFRKKISRQNHNDYSMMKMKGRLPRGQPHALFHFTLLLSLCHLQTRRNTLFLPKCQKPKTPSPFYNFLSLFLRMKVTSEIYHLSPFFSIWKPSGTVLLFSPKNLSSFQPPLQPNFPTLDPWNRGFL